MSGITVNASPPLLVLGVRPEKAPLRAGVILTFGLPIREEIKSRQGYHRRLLHYLLTALGRYAPPVTVLVKGVGYPAYGADGAPQHRAPPYVRIAYVAIGLRYPLADNLLEVYR